MQTLAMPHQLNISINACLGKKEGLRTITLTSVLYAVWNRAQNNVRNWELENMKDFDTCKPGSSALLAALGRALQAEIAEMRNQKIGTFFHDYQKFFDSLDVSELLEQALHTSYPPVHLAFAIQQHVAPRVIKLQNFIGRPIEVYNSIIAGCLQSVPMTRVYLQQGIEKVVSEENAVSEVNIANLSQSRECELVGVTCDREMARTQLYVDDCAQSSRDKCGGIVHNRLGNSFYIFHKMNKKLKLTLSEKGVIVANCPKLAKRLQTELLQLHGIKYNIKKSTRDLGISHTAGTCKPNQLLLERLHGKEIRISKIGRISRMHRNGRNLYKGS